ncbi:similar to Saccharomyces cerevisiae YDL005C MED2 Subunit of the RNA polymerase II mediator complex [Maudiozyma saulgeensis]|uniref:Similar to Saccharomyces cerevisiae YDL005C MED2 Subunit of the RNA polymerase II mediator complex n=1 Tax=Maudiozyma saulgeensis TaxID=1789683 RepID=A0A1X7R3Y0_9SACH|nr:similar to Saccharomyces cerevisiae YDL005C MED2 Subunit of the RNA polymerase II mediator complex [Kazachstania saulgeensis]
MVAKNSVTIENVNSPTTQLHKNKLTQCFDDMMRMSSEMLVQEQLKTIQLDNGITNGFSATHQKNLKEKFHVFHGILDDLDITLDKCATYVETLNKIGIEKEELRKKEEELEAERQKKLEEEKEQQRIAKEELMKKEKEEQEQKEKEKQEKEKREKEKREAQQKENNVTGNALDLMDDMRLSFNDDVGVNVDGTQNDLLGSFNSGDKGSNNTPGILAASAGVNDISDPLQSLTSAGETDDKNNSSNKSNNNKGSNNNANNANDTGANSVFNDLDAMDMSLFTDLDNTNFDPLSETLNGTNDLTGKDTAMNDNNNNSNNNDTNNNNSNNNNGSTNNNQISTDNGATATTGAINVDNENNGNVMVNNNNDSLNMMEPLQDMGDDYLTLNDFNDLNIDWNAGGDSGDLDLNDFNI